MDAAFKKELERFDHQLFISFDPMRQRWVVYRMGEKHGSPHTRSWAIHEVALAKENGAVWEILVCQDNEAVPMTPSWWVLDYLRQRDARRINLKQFVREMDDRNEKRKEKAREDADELLRYRITEDWRYIRDELRGDGGRRHTITK